MAGESAALADKYLNRIVVAPGRRVSIERDYDPALGKGRLSKQEAADLLADSRDARQRPGKAVGPGSLRPADHVPGHGCRR
jgi:hypothetical protein